MTGSGGSGGGRAVKHSKPGNGSKIPRVPEQRHL